MKEKLLTSLESLQIELHDALKDVESPQGLQEARVLFLGKKGKLTQILKGLGKLDAKDRPQVGAKANEIKENLEEIFDAAELRLQAQVYEQAIAKDLFDISLPGRPIVQGHVHPLTQIYELATQTLEKIGFQTYSGPEIEDDYHNFEALNIPEDHPARDLQDTFYLPGLKWLLRTHTSTVQIHVMEQNEAPIRMIAPGVVYRADSDVTHTPMFHQIEGLWIDQKTTFADLKGVLTLFIQEIFDQKTQVRFRPSYFPFTEPSAELDISCVFCQGKKKNCAICKGTGWLEILGCGMVDPAVFKYVKYDEEKYTGFAFGIGLERLAMLKFGINDLRLFFENDYRFLEQF
ncbi:MAG: phenylalanine--tRNA ligase subunit alpha [Deltaproteobacteria bacterium]|nr:phenylalanine--tRNA ligase subunit alpha [Deltaproteobacteria bacterium]